MAAPRLRVLVVLGLLLVAWLGTAESSTGCPFCMEERGPTLMGDFEQAAMVLVGTFKNPKAGAGFEEGTTDFVIEKALKTNDIIKDKKIITLPRYINQPKNKFLIFCEVYNPPNVPSVEYLTQAVLVPAEDSTYHVEPHYPGYCVDCKYAGKARDFFERG